MDFACRLSNLRTGIRSARFEIFIPWIQGKWETPADFHSKWGGKLDRSIFSLIVIPKEARAWGELSRFCCG